MEEFLSMKFSKKLVFLLIGLVFLSGCVEQLPQMPTERETPQKTIKELESVEIREYEGEKLDSMQDVRDVSIKGPQYIDINEYKLEVSGLVENSKNYTYDEVLGFQKYSKVVTIQCIIGWTATVLWEGILLKDLFEEVNVKPEANTVIFYAVDGYTTSLPLDYIIDNDIILADKINNMTLVPERGFPFMLVAENKYGYKWIKWITKIELSDNEDYLGYWESAGYDNEAGIE
jgi:DMSO/TMAO reductase YedYZ molybdopterin-dependent catalytic subunit